MAAAVWFRVPYLYADWYETQDSWGMGYEKGQYGFIHDEVFAPEDLCALQRTKHMIRNLLEIVKNSLKEIEYAQRIFPSNGSSTTTHYRGV